ncbi:MAG: glycine--tRNA ligase subunit beta [Paracoccaceae bacterium]
MPDLLLELFSEEIPARMQARAAEDLKRLVTGAMVERGLTYSAAAAFVTPRRLALSVAGLPKATMATREERKGPRTDAPEKALEGFLRSTGLTKDQLERREDKKGEVWFAVIARPGRPAAEVIAEAVTETIRAFPWPRSMRWGSGDLTWVRPLRSILCILTDEAGREVIPFAIDHLSAGAATEGHRFMAPAPFEPKDFDDYAARLLAAKVVLDPAERQARIRADAGNMAFAAGMELVEDESLLAEVAGLVEWPVALMGDIEERFLGLPPEVLQTSMKEHQKFFSVRNPKTGRIEKFITVANVETADGGATILAGNQRVLAARLSDALFFWENDLRTIREGGMEAMAKPLENVTFHNKLGSQAERVERIAALAREIAPLVGADPDKAERAAKIAKADLCSEMVYEFPELQGTMGKYYAEAAGEDAAVAAACAGHYAPLGPSDAVPTEPVAVAVSLADKIDTLTGFWAIDEKPTGSKDPFALRRAALGVIRIVFVSELNEFRLGKLIELSYLSHVIFRGLRSNNYFKKMTETQNMQSVDNPVFHWHKVPDWALFSSDQMISSNVGDVMNILRGIGPEYFEDTEGRASAAYEAYDALVRRAELLDGMSGVAQFVMSGRVPAGGEEYFLRYMSSLDQFWECWKSAGQETAGDLVAFFADRLKQHLRAEGVRHDVIDACFQLGGQDDLVLLVNRVKALQGFVDTEDGANLLSGYKRAANILAAEQKKDGVEYTLDPDPKFAEAEEEKALFAALDAADAAIRPALEAEDFAAAMTAMAGLRAPIDAFLDKVQVNAENQIIRRNRLCLLNRVKVVMERVAIFSAIEG